MKQDLPELYPFSSMKEIDYDKERVFKTPHGAKVVVPLEGIIKWQKRQYQREINELKAHFSDLEAENKRLVGIQKSHDNQVSQYKGRIKELQAQLKDNPQYRNLQREVKLLRKENTRLSKINKEYVVRLTNNGISAAIEKDTVDIEDS